MINRKSNQVADVQHCGNGETKHKSIDSMCVGELNCSIDLHLAVRISGATKFARSYCSV